MKPELSPAPLASPDSLLVSLAVSPDPLLAWWVAHTRPRQEKALAADLTTLGIPCYLPLYEKVTRSRRTGRLSRSLVPVFSGYLFVQGTNEQRHRMLRTGRVAQVLTVGNQARLVGELSQVQLVLSDRAAFRVHRGLKIGAWARVTGGPLAGVEGVVERRLSRVRLVLNVEMLGQSISVEVLEDMLEAIDAPGYSV